MVGSEEEKIKKMKRDKAPNMKQYYEEWEKFVVLFLKIRNPGRRGKKGRKRGGKTQIQRRINERNDETNKRGITKQESSNKGRRKKD